MGLGNCWNIRGQRNIVEESETDTNDENGQSQKKKEKTLDTLTVKNADIFLVLK